MEYTFGQIQGGMKDSIQLIRSGAMELIGGQMERFIMVGGMMASSMV